MAAVADAFRPPVDFDPQRAQLTVRLAATDIGPGRTPDLLCALAREAPRIDLVVRTADHDQVNAWLQSGEVALAWASGPAAQRPEAPAADGGFVLLVRPGHPLQGELTPERLAAFPAVLVAPGGGPRGIADAASPPWISAAAWPSRSSASLARTWSATATAVVFPRSLAVAAGAPLGRTILPLPLDIGPFMVEMMWLHARPPTPALAWLGPGSRRWRGRAVRCRLLEPKASVLITAKAVLADSWTSRTILRATGTAGAAAAAHSARPPAGSAEGKGRPVRTTKAPLGGHDRVRKGIYKTPKG